MAKISGPFVLTPNVELDVPVPATLGGLPIAITIGNESPYLCQVSISNSTYWLAPLTQDTFLVPPNINLVPIVGEALSGAVPSGSNSDIYAIWYTTTDKIDAASIQHPVSLTGNAVGVGSTISGNVVVTGPLDGGGFLEVSVKGPVDGGGNVKSAIAGPLDGGGNVKVAVGGPLDGNGNLKVAVTEQPVQTTQGQPPGTALEVSSGNEANHVAVATLPAAALKTTYITGFDVTAGGATAENAVTVTVVGPANTLSYTFTFPGDPSAGASPLIVKFPNPIPAAAVNTAIVVSLPASGAGGTNAAVNAYGFQL